MTAWSTVSRRIVLVGALAVVVGLVAACVAFGPGRLSAAVPGLVAGWSAVACGLAAWQHASWSRPGPLLACVGLTWVAQSV